MGSRIMHLAIAKTVADRLDLPYEPFAFGNLIVDAHENRSEKQTSHYKIAGADFYSDLILNEDGFRDKYMEHGEKPVYLGYYSHLITDHLWLKQVYRTTMVNPDGSIKVEQMEDYYNDYGILNRLLIDEYELEGFEAIYHHEIDEVNSKVVPEIMAGLQRDFRETVDGQLKVMEMETIKRFIDDSVAAVTTALEGWLETGQ